MSTLSGHCERSRPHPLDDLALYALDGLEGDEIRTVEAHLTTCGLCQRELAAHEGALSVLTEDGPPPALWDAVRAQIRELEAAAADEVSWRVAGPAPTRADPSSRRGARRRLAVLAAAAAVAAVLAVGLGTRLGNDGDSDTIAGNSIERTIAVLADPQGADVAHVLATDDGDVMVLDRLGGLPPRETYQLWSLDRGRPVSLGLLGDGDDHAVEVNLPPGAARLAISREPAGGSPAPTALVATGTVVRSA